MKAIIIATALAALPIAALAQQPPRYDVEAHCEAVASVGGELSNSTYNGCIRMEQSAYDSLKGGWNDLPPNVMNHCHKVATVGGAGSYSTLKGCVRMEMSAGQNRSEFSFD